MCVCNTYVSCVLVMPLNIICAYNVYLSCVLELPFVFVMSTCICNAYISKSVKLAQRSTLDIQLDIPSPKSSWNVELAEHSAQN